jgi:hypothetical protein
MKNLDLNQMETVIGGDTLDGVCAVIGVTDAALGVRFLLSRVIAVTPIGATILAVGTIACAGRALDLY